MFNVQCSMKVSERVDSNSRPPRPERGTLPTALLSEWSLKPQQGQGKPNAESLAPCRGAARSCNAIILNCDAKVRKITDIARLFTGKSRFSLIFFTEMLAGFGFLAYLCTRI